MARRGPWNAAAAAARARGADREPLAGALREVGAALGAAGPPSGSPALAAVADALVPAALDLVAQRRWSGAPRRALLAVPGLLAHCGADGEHAPALVADLLAASARVQRWGDASAWLERLVAAADAARPAGPDPLRRLGVLAAWRSGAARLRRAALDSAPAVPPAAACAALSLPRLDARELAAVLERHAADPWWWPAPGGDDGARGVRARLGGFRGFGGPWPRPPRVVGALGRDGTAWDVATDHPERPGQEERWRVLADVHGVAVHRWTPRGGGGAGTGSHPVPVSPPWDDDVTGWAVAGRTAVLSRARSHLLDVVVVP